MIVNYTVQGTAYSDFIVETFLKQVIEAERLSDREQTITTSTENVIYKARQFMREGKIETLSFQHEGSYVGTADSEGKLNNWPTGFGDFMDLCLDALIAPVPKEQMVQSKRFDIWSEGYVAMGDSGKAYKLARAYGATFEEACKNYAEKHSDFAKTFDAKRMTYWGCRLFDNEADARRSFG